MGHKPIERAPCDSGAPLRLGVLVSGSCAQLQSLIEASAKGTFNASIELVLSNRKEALALDRARAANIETRVLREEAFEDAISFDRALLETFQTREVELVCLCDFDRPLTPEFMAAFEHRVLDIYPSLLPAFAEGDPIASSLESSVRITGCSLFFYRPEVRFGPLLLQSALPVWPDDDVESLAVRLEILENRTLISGIALITSGKVRIDGDRVVVEDIKSREDTLEWYPESSLARAAT